MCNAKLHELMSHLEDRIGCAEFTLPPRADGPPAHWHEMHDECFMVTQGKMRFHSYDGKIVDAGLGDWVTVPTRAPHTFTNPFDEVWPYFLPSLR